MNDNAEAANAAQYLQSVKTADKSQAQEFLKRAQLVHAFRQAIKTMTPTDAQRCETCNAWKFVGDDKANPVLKHGVCRSAPPIPLMIGMARTKAPIAIAGMPPTQDVPIVNGYSSSRESTEWCRGWEPCDALLPPGLLPQAVKAPTEEVQTQPKADTPDFLKGAGAGGGGA